MSFCEQIDEDAIDLVGNFDHLVALDLSGCNCTDSVSNIFCKIFLNDLISLFLKI